jgi:hypothetical protein
MDFELIKQKLIESVQQVINDDSYLLHHDISERAISHRLAMYLAYEFKDFDVDCEYNGNIDADNGRKYIYILNARAKELGLQNIQGEDDETSFRGVYPDIIVHKRGMNGADNNLLIIEIKKSSSQVNGEWDAEKLSRFTSSEYENRFEFRYGAFVKFNVGEQVGYTVEWYKDGLRWHNESSDSLC